MYVLPRGLYVSALFSSRCLKKATHLMIWVQNRVRHHYVFSSTGRKDDNFGYVIWGQWIASSIAD
jgi:hypothetical protein